MFSSFLLSAFLLANVADGAVAPAASSSVCIETNIRSDGKTRGSKIAVGSGDTSIDKGALQFIKALDFSHLSPVQAQAQSGYAVVRATGKDTYTLDVTGGPLLSACPESKAAQR